MNKLREKRLAYNYTLKSLAQKAGVSNATIHYLEVGSRNGEDQYPTITVARKLANVFGMKPEALFPHIKSKIGRPNIDRFLVRPCPPKVKCSWCGNFVCPFLVDTIVVEGKTLMIGHALCKEQEADTRQLA
jgi:transcriptional regulator with XRE-family HTH domain